MKLKSKILPCVALTMLCALITPRSLAMIGTQRDEQSPEPPKTPTLFAQAPSDLFSTAPVVPTSGKSSCDVRHKRTSKFRSEPYPASRRQAPPRIQHDAVQPDLTNPTLSGSLFEDISLHDAIIRGLTEHAKTLIAQKELDELEETNACGKTALHLAVEQENLELVITLLDKGVNVNAEDNKNQTPLTLARYTQEDKISKNPKKLMKIMERLKEKGGIDPKAGKPREIKVMQASAPGIFWFGAFK